MTADQRELVYTPDRKITLRSDAVLDDWKPDTSKGKSGNETMHQGPTEQRLPPAVQPPAGQTEVMAPELSFERLPLEILQSPEVLFLVYQLHEEG